MNMNGQIIYPDISSQEDEDPRSLYKRNLENLRRYFPQLHRKIEELEDDGTCRTIETISGKRTLQVLTNDAWYNLSTTVDPHKAAIERTQALQKERKEKDLEDWFFLGVGPGHELVDYCATEKKGFVLVYEPNPQIFKKSMEIVDYSAFFNRKEKYLFLTEDRQEFSELLFQFLARNFLPNLTISINEHELRVYPQDFQTVQKEVKDCINRFMVNINTSAKFGKRFAYNMLRNVPEILKTGDERKYENAFSGIPIIVVAAGPSLTDSLEDLKRVQKKALIVAVDSALKPLLDAGIEPHFVTSIDIQASKSVIYREVEKEYSDSKYTVAQVLYTHPRLTQAHAEERKKIFLWVASPVSSWLEKSFGKHPDFGECLSCAHAAFYFARFLGGDPIVLVGQDLCHSKGDKERHVKGAIGTHSSRPGAHRYNWEKDPGKCLVLGNDGEQKQSVLSLAAFIKTYEIAISQTKQKVYNATREGAKIEGAEWKQIEDLEKDILVENLDLFEKIDGLHQITIDKDIERSLRKELRHFKGFLDTAQENNKALRKTSKEAQKILKRRHFTNEIRTRLATLDTTRQQKEAAILGNASYSEMLKQPLLQLSVRLKLEDKKIARETDQVKRGNLICDRYLTVTPVLEETINFFDKTLDIIQKKIKESR